MSSRIITQQVIETLADRVVACAKIRVDGADVKKTVKGILAYCEYFNTIGAFDTRSLNRELDQIDIINEFKDFITPKTIRYAASDIDCTDLLVRPQTIDGSTVAYTYEDFMNLQIKFRGYFKKDTNSDTTKLNQIKVDESLANIMPRIGIIAGNKVKVRYLTESYIPVIVDKMVSPLFRPQHFNSDAEEIVKDYLAPKVF